MQIKGSRKLCAFLATLFAASALVQSGAIHGDVYQAVIIGALLMLGGGNVGEWFARRNNGE